MREKAITYNGKFKTWDLLLLLHWYHVGIVFLSKSFSS